MDLFDLHVHYYGSKANKYYGLARSYRENGKNKKETILKIGKLNEDQARWLKFALKILKASHPRCYAKMALEYCFCDRCKRKVEKLKSVKAPKEKRKYDVNPDLVWTR